MQTILSQLQPWTNQMSYGFKRLSQHKVMLRRNKYYASKPELYQKFTQIKKKIDFKNGDLTFPINIPLKFRFAYRPKKHMIKKVTPEDTLNFEIMTGNEILLYLEQSNNLRTHELISALIQVRKRDIHNQHNLKEHKWVIQGVKQGFEILNHLTREEFVRFSYAVYRLGYGNEEEWQALEARTRVLLPNMKAKHFGQIYLMFFEDQGQRSSEEFRRDLALLLPIHLKKLSPLTFTRCFELTYEHKLMTEYLFEDHMHQIFWKRLNWFLTQKAFSQMLAMFRQANYEEDEYLWPDVYKTLKENVQTIDYDQVRPIRDELVKLNKQFRSHQQYNIDGIIYQLSQRVTWEETLGGVARKTTLVDMVKNDLLFYREKKKLELAQ